MLFQQGIVISLQRAANGWIVELPQQFSEAPIVDWTDPDQVKPIIQMMKQEYQKDPVLEDLGHYENTPMPGTGPKIRIVPGPVKGPDSNIYIFSTYDEAAAFIKERYDS